MTQRGYQVIKMLPIKSKMAAARKRCLAVLFAISVFYSGGGGTQPFFQVGVCGPDFRSVGLANWCLPLKRGACELKISKFGGLSCELKISKFGGLWAKIWMKIEAVEAKFPNFLKRVSCELTLLLEMGPLRTTGEAWKGGLQGRTSPYPLSRSVSLQDFTESSPPSFKDRGLQMAMNFFISVSIYQQ